MVDIGHSADVGRSIGVRTAVPRRAFVLAGRSRSAVYFTNRQIAALFIMLPSRRSDRTLSVASLADYINHLALHVVAAVTRIPISPIAGQLAGHFQI
jgi:hypothetical protein